MKHTLSAHSFWTVAVFTISYLCIIFEHWIGINKTIVAVIAAAVLWGIQFVASPDAAANMQSLTEHFSGVSQIVIFLLCAVTIVETIYIHGGLQLITKLIRIPSKRGMLCAISIITFFISALLDNLTTTIVMLMLLRKLVYEHEERLLFGSAIVIAANAGGAWSPIGDVTTTMLWIGGQISAGSIVRSLFIPSLVCLVVALAWLSLSLRGTFSFHATDEDMEIAPGGTCILIAGGLALLLVPIIKIITGLPPFMAILFSTAGLWLLTDCLHTKESEKHLRLGAVFNRIDFTLIFFFLGILLSVNALEATGALQELALWLDDVLPSTAVVAMVIGLASAVIDNVPLVAACMGMYTMDQYPANNALWELIAYTAGTGGSILIIGSAAGVAFMGIEKVHFFWYVKRAAFPAFVGYLAGIATYLWLI